jgi:hypothetical protein
MARALFGIATDAGVSNSVKLAAIRDDALDRAGLNPKAAWKWTSHKPCEQILDNLAGTEGGSRAEWRCTYTPANADSPG